MEVFSGLTMDPSSGQYAVDAMTSAICFDRRSTGRRLHAFVRGI